MRFEVDNRTVNATMAGGSLAAPGPAALLIHGAGMDRSAWQLQTRYLSAHQVRAVAVDLPGHGRSEGPALTSVGHIATWVGAVLDALDLERAYLIGHSMGALAAVQAAADLGQRISGISLLGAAASMGVHPDLQTAANANDPLAAALMTSWGHGRAAHIGAHTAPGLWMLGGSDHLIRRTPAGSLGVDLALCGSYDGMLEAAARVQCPSQLILGLQDRMTPRKAAQPLIDALPDPVVHEFDCGHMLMWEQPNEVRKLLTGAVRSTG